jgi:uncharacterized RmlC-like cupin family protein
MDGLGDYKVGFGSDLSITLGFGGHFIYVPFFLPYCYYSIAYLLISCVIIRRQYMAQKSQTQHYNGHI